MQIDYFRSSSFNTWDFCPHQYFLSYVLNLPYDVNKKAERGTIVHKALECLAKISMCKKSGQSKFTDDLIGEQDIDIPLHKLINLSYYAISSVSKHQYNNDDLTECARLVNIAYNSSLNPLKRDVIAPERYFDIEIPHEWAKTNDGTLRLKGTIDLVVSGGEDLYEIIDFKTGRRWDWAKNKEKTNEHLQDDPQLRIYHYAASLIYPHIKHFAVTIYFINDGGPFTMFFGQSDIDATIEMLKNRFLKIRSVTRPMLNKSWKCSKFCHFGMNKSELNPEKTLCEYYKEQILLHGMNSVIEKFGTKNAYRRS